MPAATNRVQLGFIEETTFGVTPTSALSVLRFTSESIAQTTGTTTSSEIREDRQIPSVVRSSVGAAGDVGFELSLGTSSNVLTLFQKALQTDAVTAADSAATGLSVTVVASAATMTVASGTPFANIAVGQWIKTSGFEDAANNGLFRVTARTNTQLTLAANSLADVTSDSGVTVTELKQFDNGKTQKSFTFEKKFGDLSNTFEIAKGMVIESMSLTVPTDGIVNGSFSLIGKESKKASSAAHNGTETADGTGSVASSIDNVKRFAMAGKDITLTEFSLNVANNLRGRQEIGDASTTSVGAGTCQVTGSFSAYFSADGDIGQTITAFEAAVPVALDIAFEVGTDQLCITMPRVLITSANRVAGGQNQDVIIEFGFEAMRDATLGSTIRMATN